jgi:hypothetical protein
VDGEMHKKTMRSGLILVFLSLITAGCFDSEGIKYGTRPTKVTYTVQYGFYINCSGSGSYDITYDCDLPGILNGICSYEILHPYDYEIKTSWNILGMGDENYLLGVQANVIAESIIVSDLNGTNALTISEIKEKHLEIFEQYTKGQTVDSTKYIDPTNSIIVTIAENVLDESETENSFIVAKNLFIWLKQETIYEPHTTNYDLQPAILTYDLKTGDCDDLSVLYMSLCRAVEIPARFIRGIIIGESEESGKIVGVPHAWVEVFVGENIGNNGWIPVECAGTASGEDKINSEVNQNFALESVEHLRLFEGTGSDESLNVSISGPLAVYDPLNMEISMESFVQILSYEILEQNELYISKNSNRIYQ